uniref:Spermatogenesis-defective protein 39 homolog n=1 Tax=Cyclopterus lumpus TaxID=8103 RepID=A0A8C2X3P4_CYCLU
MMKSKADEEDYWNSSKFKAFTFDDEDDEFSTLKESKRTVNSIRCLVEEDDDKEEVEKVSWNGEPVSSNSWSVSETAASNQRAEREPAFPKINTVTISKSHSGYSLSSLFKGETDGKVSLTGSSVLMMSSCCDQDYVSDWSPEETVHRMQQGKVSHLREVLFRELEPRQTALSHLIHYLTETRDQRLLLELYTCLTCFCFQLLQYKEHLSIADENKRRDFLKSCLSLPFSPEDSSHVQDHYTLMERQVIIETTDRRAERGEKVERALILNMPLITTLSYCCLYHYSESEGTFSSPLNIRQTFKISEKQFFVTALGARAKLKAWSDVDALFTSRNWLGFTRKKSPLGFQRVVDILQKNSAPTQVLQDYVALVDDAELRITLAQKHKCHDIVINTYRDLKDRQQLLGYRGKVERGSGEERKIDELLNNLQIRWKN